jgi:threonine dehydrogenase-like Zn-dependent dehydrogenase
MSMGMAEYLKAPGRKTWWDSVDFEVGSIAETLAVGYNAIRLKAKAGAGDIVVILGAGPVGMDVLACARASGAYIIISDVMKNRLEIARTMGADRVVCTVEEDLAKVVSEASDGRGADVVVEPAHGR